MPSTSSGTVLSPQITHIHKYFLKHHFITPSPHHHNKIPSLAFHQKTCGLVVMLSKKMKRLIIIGFIFLCCLSSKAQNKYFPIKGSIISADSLTPIPNAHILSMLSYYGTISDINGYFSMLTRETDSLRISSIGFLTQYIYLKHDSIDANNFNIVMQRDTVILEEIEVFPYLNYQTVKEIISKIPVEKPMTIKGVNENIESVLYLKPKKTPDDKGILSPVQTLYNRFNKKERLKRKLEKNRKKYSKQE